ncbi:MAG: hypothetical protein ABI347_11465 [Nitrososphaera sp.]|jgi:hypothetical protein
MSIAAAAVVEYHYYHYDKKSGNDDGAHAAFIRPVREIGEIAFAMEKNNAEHAKLEGITGSVALLHCPASKEYCFEDVNENMQRPSTRKRRGRSWSSSNDHAQVRP